MVQVADLGQGLERVSIWPKNARRAGYTPVFPMPEK
jgi:branched-chain amino acid transport system substrate-binding protein